jgi:tetratricopeptide (TPR) repeat protein
MSGQDRRKTTKRVSASIVTAVFTLIPAVTVVGQVSERDKLLNCFYDARVSRPADARSCLTRLLDAQPGDTQALLELGFFEVAQKNDAAAIEALNKAVASGSKRADVRAQLGYLHLARGEREIALTHFEASTALDPANEQVQMQKGFVLDQIGRKREAQQVFDLVAKQSSSDAVRRQACSAAEVLAPLAMRRLPRPYYVDIYTAPDWYSSIDVATLPLRVRGGVAVGPGDRIELFGQTSILADNRSRLTDQAGPIIYFDNVMVLGGGASFQPFASIGLTVSTEIGAAYDLFDRQREPWRFDARTGLQYYGAWQHASRCPASLSVPLRPVFEAYGASIYFSRYDNLISSARLRPGLRILESARMSLDANLHLAGIVDTEGEDFNNLFEIGGGVILTPDRRLGLRLGIETVQRRFRDGDHDVVTRIRVEYAARF